MDIYETKYIENAAAEYRRLSERLKEIDDSLRTIAPGAASGERWKLVTGKWAERIEAQSRSLKAMASSLEEIVFNRRLTERDLDTVGVISDYDTYGGEFGVSHFENLEEHEEIMPIHTA